MGVDPPARGPAAELPAKMTGHWLAGMATLLVALLLATEQLFLPWVVAGPSMAPTLLAGDRLLIDRWTYRHRLPRPGEIVLIAAPSGTLMLKRVAPMPRTSSAPSARFVWVLGDNPDRSLDSRRFGPVPASSARGRVVLRYWPLDRAGRLSSKAHRAASPR